MDPEPFLLQPNPMDNSLISVCICTYQRPGLLDAALKGIVAQNSDGAFQFEIVVADNDCAGTAAPVVKQFKAMYDLYIQYIQVPEKNIALARNAAVKHARGSYIAFIDDDEVPSPNWLHNLHATLTKYRADGALGPVLPAFPDTAPDWVLKANIFDRHRFPTGTPLTVRHTRTGNVLLRKTLFQDNQLWFDPAFGITGGEDVNFFERRIREGRTFVWCDEAEAIESVTEDRCTMKFHFKKFIRIGATNGKRLRKLGAKGFINQVKSIIGLPAKLILLAVTLPFGRHIWMQYALKALYAASSILSYAGVTLIRHRD